jgi:hypothetical protein
LTSIANDRDRDQEHADESRADDVEVGVAGQQRQAHRQERRHEADQRGEVFEQDDRELGRLGAADE